MKVIGIRKVDYVNKQNRRIQGLSLYCVSPMPPEYGQGYWWNKEGRTFFVPSDALSSMSRLPQLDDEVEIGFDFSGRFQDIRFLD